MHFCRVTHVLYLCHNTYFWGAWMIKSFFFSFLFFQVTWQKLVMSWGPLKSSGTNQGWWVWNEISVVLGVFHNWYWTELFSKVDYFNNCWRTVWTLSSVNYSSEVCHCLLRFQLWSRCTPMKKTLTALSTFSNKLLSTISLNRFVSI